MHCVYSSSIDLELVCDDGIFKSTSPKYLHKLIHDVRTILYVHYCVRLSAMKRLFTSWRQGFVVIYLSSSRTLFVLHIDCLSNHYIVTLNILERKKVNKSNCFLDVGIALGLIL
jgi:hypothetical protein